MAARRELWFYIMVMILSFAVVVSSIVNIVVYNDASKGKCQGFSSGFAIFMLVVNIILLIASVGIFIWTIINLLYNKDEQKQVKSDLKSHAKNTDLYKSLNSKDSVTTQRRPVSSSPPRPEAVNQILQEKTYSGIANFKPVDDAIDDLVSNQQ